MPVEVLAIKALTISQVYCNDLIAVSKLMIMKLSLLICKELIKIRGDRVDGPLPFHYSAASAYI